MKSIRTSLGIGPAIAILFFPGIAAAQKPQASVLNPVSVVVAPVGPGMDSVRAILQRDFDYSDRLSPLALNQSPLAALAADGSPNFPQLAKLKARALIIPRAEANGIRVAYYDVHASHLVQQAFFPLAGVSGLRAGELRDSLIRAHATRDSLTQLALIRVSLLRDSLFMAAHGKPVHDRAKQAVIQALRDAMIAAAQAEESRLVAQRSRDLMERDSAIPLLALRESAKRDSLVYVNRMAIHAMADEVTRWITGRRGYAQSRVVYVSNGTLRIVDSDGANDRALTESGLALSPSWHPDGNRVVFSHFTRAGTQIAQVDVWSRQVTMVGATPRGLNMTPAYTPDGRRIIYSNGSSGPAELVETLADSTIPAHRLSFAAQETSSPTFSPDGRLAYISPKLWQGSGSNGRFTPQIYVMNSDGTGVTQLTPTIPGVRSYRTSPDWSPDGARVAYMQQQGDFQLWTIDLKSRQMRQITSKGSENEDPTWSPDSRHLAFTSNRSGAKEIWVLDTQSGRYRQLTHKGGARLAAWSKVYDPIAFAARSTAVTTAALQQEH